MTADPSRTVGHARLDGLGPPGITRRRFLAGVAGVAAGLAAPGSYAWWVAPYRLDVVNRPMVVDDLPADLEGAVVAHLSDIHVGLYVSDDYVLEVFRTVAAAAPDIVALTGDLTSHHSGVLGQVERIFGVLPAGRLATVAVLGNHDYGPGWADTGYAAALTATLEDLGIRVLRNETVDVGGLRIVGMDDLWAGRFEPRAALEGVDPSIPALALSHNPDTVDLEGWDAFRGWVLAGHTHGGQVRAPFLPPPVLPVKNRQYAEGAFDLGDGRNMYVSRGVGHLRLRARVFVPPEVTLFEMRGT